MSTVMEIEKAIEGLPTREMLELAEWLDGQLRAQLGDCDGDDGQLSPAWRAEIESRMESIRQGTAVLIPHDEVMTGLRGKLAAARSASRKTA